MATADTVTLSAPHAPKEASLAAFDEFAHELKQKILHERHVEAKHAPYFAAAEGVSDADLTSFTKDDFVQVRHAQVAYGHILFGKVRVPALAKEGRPAYIHFRAFEPEPGTEKKATVHSIHTEMKKHDDEPATYRALFPEDEPLEWFDT